MAHSFQYKLSSCSCSLHKPRCQGLEWNKPQCFHRTSYVGRDTQNYFLWVYQTMLSFGIIYRHGSQSVACRTLTDDPWRISSSHTVHILLPFFSFLLLSNKTAKSWFSALLALLLRARKYCTTCWNVTGFWMHWFKKVYQFFCWHLLKANSWPSLAIWQEPGAQQYKIIILVFFF